MNKYTRVQKLIFRLSLFLLNLPNWKRNKNLWETLLQHPGVVRLYVNAFYFSTKARRVTSPLISVQMI